MKVQHGKDVASHSGPESCGGAREGVAEALTGETGGSAIEPRNQRSGTPDAVKQRGRQYGPGR
jgi:RNA-directed DNA polymerase